jgi:hypothetical protein
VISPSQRPLPTQDNTKQKDEDKHPCLKPDRTHDLSAQAIKVYASDLTAALTGELFL